MVPTRYLLLFTLVPAAGAAVFDVNGGLAVLLAIPVMIGPLTVSRSWHPATWLLGLALFACLVAGSPLLLSAEMLSMRIEAAFLFSFLLTAWCGLTVRKSAQ